MNISNNGGQKNFRGSEFDGRKVSDGQTSMRVAFVGNYLPRECGIATFTTDLCAAVASGCPASRCSVVAVNDHGARYQYSSDVEFEIAEQEIDQYREAADFLNSKGVDVVCLQHEFGVYGGAAGEYILALLDRLDAPVVTTFHTLLEEPNSNYKRVTLELVRRSGRLVVMTARMERLLCELYHADPAKIDLIPHGIPEVPWTFSDLRHGAVAALNKRVLLTFGLLSPGKGIEYVIRALPDILELGQEVLYLVVGATHPKVLKEHGEAYRDQLEALVRKLDLGEHVEFHDRFVELEELKQFIAAADIYVTPYINAAQAVSGTLAYASGCGKPVVSTPYWHAQELLADGRGLLVPFRDSAAFGTALTTLLMDDDGRLKMARQAYRSGRETVWPRVAMKYFKSFQRAHQGAIHSRGAANRVNHRCHGKGAMLPDFNLEHLKRMTDSTGLFQHAVYTVPNLSEGYCTDDNARALILALRLEELGLGGNAVGRLCSTYSAFLHHAFHQEARKFRNFMSFERQWLEPVGSADSQGRALWGLGFSVGHGSGGTPMIRLFNRALPAAADFRELRSIAFALLGVVEYLKRFRGDRGVKDAGERLTHRLYSSLRSNRRSEWFWFQDFLSYDNARLAQALIAGGRQSADRDIVGAGLEALRWLVQIQGGDTRHLRPVGSQMVYRQGGSRPRFDQQPLEAWATVSACLEAFLTTSRAEWYTRARQAFDWFLGRNDLGLSLYDPSTGGCRDGIHPDRLNQNQGAESTLSFMLSLAELLAFQQMRQPLADDTLFQPMGQTH